MGEEISLTPRSTTVYKYDKVEIDKQTNKQIICRQRLRSVLAVGEGETQKKAQLAVYDEFVNLGSINCRGQPL